MNHRGPAAIQGRDQIRRNPRRFIAHQRQPLAITFCRPAAPRARTSTGKAGRLMPVSRRLRFEILRRDGHTCRYCGAMAPDVKLAVDHVIPVTLGGSDDPTNLVAACVDCNSGKTSIAPGSELVADVAADALRWSRALEMAASNLMADRELIDASLERFKAKWQEWKVEHRVTVPAEPVIPTGDILIDNWVDLGSDVARHSRPISFEDGVLSVLVEKGYVTGVKQDLNYAHTRKTLRRLLKAEIATVTAVVADLDWPGPLPARSYPTTRIEHHPQPLPAGWRDSVQRFIALGLPEEELHRFVDTTRNAVPYDPFRFFCGCCWRAITDLQEDARRIVETER